MVVAADEIIDFMAKGMTPQELIAFQASERTKERVADLIAREKTTGISPEETEELNTYLELEHVMILAKARARQRLQGQ